MGQSDHKRCLHSWKVVLIMIEEFPQVFRLEFNPRQPITLQDNEVARCPEGCLVEILEREVKHDVGQVDPLPWLFLWYLIHRIKEERTRMTQISQLLDHASQVLLRLLC